MADDLYDVYDGDSDDLTWEDEIEEDAADEAQAEGQNRTFLIAVAILGGLLVCAIGAFMVWALVINPRMQAQIAGPVIDETPTEEVIAEETPTPELETPTEQPPDDEPTALPTDTPRPTPTATPTPVIGQTNTPTPGTGEEGSSGGSSTEPGSGEATPTETPRARRTATPTRVSEATPTPRSTRTITSSTDKTPDTGLGEVLLVIGAILMLGVLFVARKLRSA